MDFRLPYYIVLLKRMAVKTTIAISKILRDKLPYYIVLLKPRNSCEKGLVKLKLPYYIVLLKPDFKILHV